MNKLKISNQSYQNSEKVYNYFLDKIWPILKIIALIFLGGFLVVLPLVSIIYLYKNPAIGLPLVISLAAFALIIIFIVKCCESNEVINETVVINDFDISVPFRLVIFQKELIKLYEQGLENVLDVFVSQYKLGNIPYAYSQGNDIAYIELCLAHDYQQCTKGQGIYQDIYNNLFKAKTTNSSNSFMKESNV